MSRRLALALVLALAGPANADEIKVWTTRALATVLAEVGPQLERTTHHKLVISVGLPTEFLRRAKAGEPFDVLISGTGAIDELIEAGAIAADSRTRIARSGIGVEVRSGAPKPDISSVEQFKASTSAVSSRRLGLTQILTTPGVEFVGPLPPAIQSYVEFTAGIGSHSKAQPAAAELIRYLTGPVATPVIKVQGMDPLVR